MHKTPDDFGDMRALNIDPLPTITIDQIPEVDLSPRQREVVALLAAGKTNREIAARLGTGVKTIDTHRGAAIKRLGVRNNADLTRYAIAAGLITVDGDVVLEGGFQVAQEPNISAADLELGAAEAVGS